MVVHKLLFIFTGAVERINAFNGQGSGLIMVTNVRCKGEEKSLLNCTHNGYGATFCSHYAGVTCPGKYITTIVHVVL